jgi:serine/threonine protein kinase
LLLVRSTLWLGNQISCPFTGRPPFVGTSITKVLVSHAREDVVPSSEFKSDVPRDLERIILRRLEKKPRDRVRTAEELEQELAACTCPDQCSRGQAATWWQQHETTSRQESTT